MKNKNLLSIRLMMIIANVCSVVNTSYGQHTIDERFDHPTMPAWVGTRSHFIVNSTQQLQLNNTVAGTSFLTTSFAPLLNDTQNSYQSLEWDIYVRLAFAGSANNYGRIFLMSNDDDLTKALTGFYIQLGEAGSNDAVELFRLSNGTSTSICRAENGTIASAFAINLRITRSEEGQWVIGIDYNGGSNFQEAATGIDATFIPCRAFGILCVYTVGNATRFYFDDIYAGPPRLPPPPPEIPEVGDVVINEFFPDPSPSVGLPAQEFVEIYNRSEKTIELKDWRLGDAATLATLTNASLGPGEYLILTPPAGAIPYSEFGRTLSVVGFPSLNNNGDAIRLLSPQGVTIDSLTYTLAWYQDQTKSNGGYTIERLNPETSSIDPTNWMVSQVSIGGTPGKVNSVFGRNPDSKKPTVLSHAFMNDSTLRIVFSEPMERERLGDPTNYRLSRTGFTKITAEQDPPQAIQLSFSKMENGYDYTLTISRVSDLAGNELDPVEIKFLFFITRKVYLKDIIITEMMVDPTPVVQLPEAEYVEIRNRSKHPINLAGWTLEDPVSRATLPKFILHANSYLVLTANANVSKYSFITNVIGVPNFPSLGNAADRITLRSPDKSLIDSVSYTNAWYRNLEKADGGWSMELIDTENLCAEEDNWAASEDPRGGTPGIVNSINGNKPDISPPKLVRAVPITRRIVELVFNERLGDGAIQAQYSITPGMGNITSRFKNQARREILLTMDDELQLRQNYTIGMVGVQDCSGNYGLTEEINVMIPEAAEVGDIVINEILFNPKPNAFDFLEIINNSDKYIDINGWRIANRTASESISTFDGILIPRQHCVFTPSRASLESNYPRAVGKRVFEMRLPSFPDDSGYAALLDQNGRVMDEFEYSAKMHSSMLRDVEGVSLERISPRVASSDLHNWHSAASVVGYATPGFQNSATTPEFVGSDLGIEVIPPIIRTQATTPFTQIHYRLDRIGMVANVVVVDMDGRLVKEIVNSATLGAEGFFQWDGDNSRGERAPVGYYTIWFQAFDLDGTVITRRRRVVVGF